MTFPIAVSYDIYLLIQSQRKWNDQSRNIVWSDWTRPHAAWLQRM